MLHSQYISALTQPSLSPEDILLGEARIAQHQAVKGRTGVPTLEQIMEKQFRDNVRRDTRAIMDNMNFSEQMAIAYVPLIIGEIAWIYADKALAIARKDKVSALKPLSRKVREIRDEYNRMLRQDLTPPHIQGFINETNRFLDTCSYDFTIFYFTVHNEVLRLSPQLAHKEIIANAFISTLMVRALRRHNKAVSKILIERLGPDKGSVTNPFLIALETLMQACTCDCPLKLDGHVQACMNIFHRNIDKIQFNLI